ncbi:MAG TPA: ATP-binding protein, partial [Bryobacteraceae bacterium]
MGELIRSKDWSATPLGPRERWPQSLRTTVSLCLASNFPINLIWGPQHIQIYNDGYRPLCGAKHPRSLGEDYTKTWASAWDILDSAFKRALPGETSFLENQRMFLDRNGYLEETFFTFSLSPIRDESGDIGGLFHPVTETTAQMLSQRRTRALQDLASRVGQSKSVEEACTLSAQALSAYQLDLPFVLIYLLDDEGSQARLTAGAHLQFGTPASPEVINLQISSPMAWPLAEVLRTDAALQVTEVAGRFGPLLCGPYPESPEAALLLPIHGTGKDRPAGFLVAGISPRLPFTDEYRAFFDLVATSITAAFANARAYQEERQRAEKLAELDRAKTAFFSNVSHEFRTPLTLMLGPLEEMLSHPGEHVAATRESVDLVHRNGLRLLRLVNTLLDFSRIEANRVEALYQPTDLAEFTRDLASAFRSTIEKAGLTLKVECSKLSDAVYVDAEMWEKIVFNLVSNAFKFTFQGTIEVALRERADHVELSVSDTGTGIPAHELPPLFKRFHRVQGAQGRAYEGTGIGLALVEDLVKLHGGTVQAESEPGFGTTFRITIPKGFQHLPNEQVSHTFRTCAREKSTPVFVEEAQRWLANREPNRPGIHGKEETGPGKRRAGRIVLADDNADMRQYIQNILAPEFEVTAVADGAEALRAVREQIPDLVLTDVMMPALDGFGLLRELRTDKRTQAIPVVMLSARAGEEARVEGLEAGADDYLVKPFNGRELVARVRVNLELSHLRQELSREEERRRSTEEIERQWRLFDTVLSHTPDFTYIFDLQGRLAYANRLLLERWKKPFSEAAGKNLLELGYPPELAARLQGQFQQVIDRRVPLRDEICWTSRSDRTRYYEYILVPVRSKDGDVEAVAGSTRDIT